MDIEIAIQTVLDALKSLGLSVPTWSVLVFATLGVLKWLGVLDKIPQLVMWTSKALLRLFYNRDERDFVGIRNRFVKHLIYEVERLNRDADWNDFHYTALEAEVEVDPALDPFYRGSNRILAWLRSIPSLVEGVFRVSPAGSVEKDLVRAIMRSRSRAFLVIGDPGSGKTVSLRHLFLRMAEKCATSNDKSSVVPLYLNLKQLDVPVNIVCATAIHDWVLEQLRFGQDRTIHDFLDTNFEQMLSRGEFFFLFDSFDEIPAVMDAQEEQNIVRQYAKSLDDFLHAPHRCRGLISSRPYRAPKVFVGQRMTIRPLSYSRIEKALYRYFIQNRLLARQIWLELVQQRDDLLHVIQIPFYLALLARYAKERQQLPGRHYELFEHFVCSRAQADEQRLRVFGLTPANLIEQGSVLAFAMTQTPHVGLEASVQQIQGTLTDWHGERVQSLLDALCYSKLGKMTREGPENSQVFSFVHRRFQEYFSARYLRQQPNSAPVEDLVSDNRWREVLVLLCEVLPNQQLSAILDVSRLALSSGIHAVPGTDDHRRAVEALRFLRDGFRSRLGDLPNDIRVLCSEFIRQQFERGDLLDQKRALEGVNLADGESASSLLEAALTSDSAWLRETALRSCRILQSPPAQIKQSIRMRLFQRYNEFDLKYDDFSFYSMLFSSPSSFAPLLHYVWLLGGTTLFQVLIYLMFCLFCIVFDKPLSLAIFLAIVFAAMLLPISKLPSLRAGAPSVLRQYLDLVGWLSAKLNELLQPSFGNSHEFGREVRGIWLFAPIALLEGICFSSVGTADLVRVLDIHYWLSPLKLPGLSLRNLAFTFYSFALIFLAPAGLALLHLVMFYLVRHYPLTLVEWIQLLPRFMAKVVSSLLKVDRYSLLKMSVALVILGWTMVSVQVFSSCGYSLGTLYTIYTPVLATLTTLAFCPVVVALFTFPAISIGGVFSFFSVLGHIIRDQGALRLLSMRASARPASAVEAVQMLSSFKSETGKAQYLRALLGWLPVGADWGMFVVEAGHHDGAVRDGLYKLAEAWQDSQREATSGYIEKGKQPIRKRTRIRQRRLRSHPKVQPDG
jgi:hypothetical protein